jgi:hypothetical protein
MSSDDESVTTLDVFSPSSFSGFFGLEFLDRLLGEPGFEKVGQENADLLCVVQRRGGGAIEQTDADFGSVSWPSSTPQGREPTLNGLPERIANDMARMGWWRDTILT